MSLRKIVYGDYKCSRCHDHNSQQEAIECNKMDENKQVREYELLKDKAEREKMDTAVELKRIEFERLKYDLEMRKMDQKQDEMKHEEKMAVIKLETLKREKSKKSTVCVLF